MVKIIEKSDCGNSPKIEFLKEFNIAFANNNIAFITKSVINEIEWNIIGDKKIKGIDDFTKKLNKMSSTKVIELIIDQIVTHGKEGAANGIIKTQNGKTYAFSDFYKFKGLKNIKLSSITSYVIEI
ncbi:nuclear transport factor 2 family protein [Polaribacter sargassicola]|uniref:nuclear transport factor 2 family protein n=1 Tax=Polaribacter sargassicola TaxID=2836891 RepID=UPI001F2ABDA8|nr:nuclear transport factor 2 family protein [Polaribacter sp. DS7-9]MCG1036264.1 nuclear transport factor 2 family protein [Polaribacter sp. DS7-9]